MLPGKILDVDYELTVTDLEGRVRRILDHCGLPFGQVLGGFVSAMLRRLYHRIGIVAPMGVAFAANGLGAINYLESAQLGAGLT